MIFWYRGYCHLRYFFYGIFSVIVILLKRLNSSKYLMSKEKISDWYEPEKNIGNYHVFGAFGFCIPGMR